MNEIFHPFLRKLLLVFFDDILTYSKTMEEHVHHLRLVLETLQTHRLFAKQSKCSFRCSKIDYLGHLISKAFVRADPSKIESMLK